MDLRLQGRVAVITGGAAGLGRAAAVRLANEGAAIEILDLQDASAAVEEIRALGAYGSLHHLRLRQRSADCERGRGHRTSAPTVSTFW